MSGMTGDELQRLTEAEQRGKSNQKRLDRLEERQDECDRLLVAMTALQTEQQNIKDDLREIKDDVKTLTMKPGRRWESVTEKVLICILSTVIAVLFARIGW
ncbi:MAG: hypothetical protein VB055_03445 [Oscillospiraceae bacterium]|nr:hypothetical protein [Oscillospiraceae bacterium]